MKDFIEGRPGGDPPLTDLDRRRLKTLAKQLRAVGAKEMVEEEIRRELPITPSDVLAIWNSLDTSKLSPELVQYIKRASHAEKLSMVKEALKGVVPEQLKRFAQVVIEKTGRMVEKEITSAPTMEDIKAEYQRLLREEIKKRHLLSESEIRDELKALSKWWRPWDEKRASNAEKEYRNRGRELYADAISVLLNSPGDLQERAPEFWRGFMAFIERKPDVAKALNHLQSLLNGDGTKLAELRANNIANMFKSGESQLVAGIRARAAAGRSLFELIRQLFSQYLVNKFAPINRRVRSLAKRGIDSRQVEHMHDELY